jgi:hypothetical protein
MKKLISIIVILFSAMLMEAQDSPCTYDEDIDVVKYRDTTVYCDFAGVVIDTITVKWTDTTHDLRSAIKLSKCNKSLLEGNCTSFKFGDSVENCSAIFSSKLVYLENPNRVFAVVYYNYSKNNFGTTHVTYKLYEDKSITDNSANSVVYHFTYRTINSLCDTNLSTYKLYPNPAVSVVTLEYTFCVNVDHLKIYLHDCYGRAYNTVDVDIGYFNGKIQLTVSDLIPGIYFCSIVADNKRIGVEKIIKQ